MSDGKKLIASLLENGSVETLRRATDDLFDDEELVSFQFVKQHFRRYGELPTIGTVEQEVGTRFPQAPEAVSYYLRRLHDRQLFVSLRENFSELREALRDMNVDRAREVVDMMKSACRTSTPDTDLRNFREAARLVLQSYEEAHLNPGMNGVPSGWRAIDTVTGGYQNGDLVSIVARMGVGKTYNLLKQALHAWSIGYSVLFVSMEMTIEQIVRRALGLEAGINPDYIRKGTLCEYGVRRLRSYAEHMVNYERMNVFAGSFAKKVGDVEVLMGELAPDIAYIDSGYLLAPDTLAKSANKIERVSGTFDGLKKVTITQNRPVVTTSQFSRQAGKRGKDGSLENVAFSDAIGMHSSLVFSLKEGKPPFQKTRRTMELMKGREGEEGEFELNYKFAPVDFSEVEPEQMAAEAVDLDWMA